VVAANNAIQLLSTSLPALHEVGGSLCKSLSSFSILLDAIQRDFRIVEEEVKRIGMPNGL